MALSELSVEDRERIWERAALAADSDGLAVESCHFADHRCGYSSIVQINQEAIHRVARDRD